MTPSLSKTPHRRVLLLLGYHLTATEQGVVKYAREAGWTLNLRMLRSGVVPEPGGIDGILCLLGGWESRPELTDFVRNAGVPAVDMHADEADGVVAGRVLVHNRKMGMLAAKHFATRGFSHCLYCCWSLSDWSARERHEGFVDALDEQGIDHHTFENVRTASEKKVAVNEIVSRLMAEIEKHAPPLGIFTENDDTAALVIDACAQLGLRVPEQVAVLGCGNDPLVVDFTRVPLSSVDPDHAERAYRASQLLDRLMDGEPVPDQPILIEPPGIVTRQSSDIMAVPDLRVAGALTYIRRNFMSVNLNSDTVSEACDVPPRTLARLFKQHLNRTVVDEIGRLRRQRAQQLLSAGGISATEVARQSGFASLLHLRRNFQRHLKMTPRQWRQREDAEETDGRSVRSPAHQRPSTQKQSLTTSQSTQDIKN